MSLFILEMKKTPQQLTKTTIIIIIKTSLTTSLTLIKLSCKTDLELKVEAILLIDFQERKKITSDKHVIMNL